jgi:hypothetical protein
VHPQKGHSKSDHSTIVTFACSPPRQGAVVGTVVAFFSGSDPPLPSFMMVS